MISEKNEKPNHPIKIYLSAFVFDRLDGWILSSAHSTPLIIRPLFFLSDLIYHLFGVKKCHKFMNQLVGCKLYFFNKKKKEKVKKKSGMQASVF
jgi:hypothetical protein